MITKTMQTKHFTWKGKLDHKKEIRERAKRKRLKKEKEYRPHGRH